MNIWHLLKSTANSLNIGTRTSSAQLTTSSSKSICTKRTQSIGTIGDWILLGQLVILIFRSLFDGERGLLKIQTFSYFKHDDNIQNQCDIWSHSVSLKQTDHVTTTWTRSLCCRNKTTTQQLWTLAGISTIHPHTWSYLLHPHPPYLQSLSPSVPISFEVEGLSCLPHLDSSSRRTHITYSPNQPIDPFEY